jgi:hypothetical protein
MAQAGFFRKQNLPFDDCRSPAAWQGVVRSLGWPGTFRKSSLRPRNVGSDRYRAVREVLMRYKPKNVAALHIALAGLPDKMRVEVDSDIGVSAKTVGELRNVTAWSENFVIATPQERYPESAVRVSKASMATRVSPKQ